MPKKYLTKLNIHDENTQKLGIKGNFYLIKGIYKKTLQLTSYLMVEDDCFVLKIQNKARSPFLPPPCYIILKDLANAVS